MTSDVRNTPHPQHEAKGKECEASCQVVDALTLPCESLVPKPAQKAQVNVWERRQPLFTSRQAIMISKMGVVASGQNEGFRVGKLAVQDSLLFGTDCKPPDVEDHAMEQSHPEGSMT